MSKVSHKFFALNQTVGRGKRFLHSQKLHVRWRRRKNVSKCWFFHVQTTKKNFFSSKQMFEAEGREKCEVIKKRRKKYSTALQHKSWAHFHSIPIQLKWKFWNSNAAIAPMGFISQHNSYCAQTCAKQNRSQLNVHWLSDAEALFHESLSRAWLTSFIIGLVRWWRHSINMFED